MSMQYAAAAQILDREDLMAQFGAVKLSRRDIRDFVAKVRPEHDPLIDAEQDSTCTTYVSRAL
jgi:aconitate decarboxylase